MLVALCRSRNFRDLRDFATSETSGTSGTSHILAEGDQRQRIVHLGIGAPPYIKALGHHLEAKATAANRTSKHWATTWRSKRGQQIVHHGIEAPFRDQSNGIKSYILALAHLFQAKAAGNKSYILALGHLFVSEATATNRTS